MASKLIDSRPTVVVYTPTLSTEAQICSFWSYPSGSTLLRTVSQADFDADRGKALLDSLSDAVEQILGEGLAVAAAGSQGLDNSNLIFDAVTFTVEYVPPTSVPGRILGSIDIPVNLLTVDTQFSAFLSGKTAQELIVDEYDRLKALAGN